MAGNLISIRRADEIALIRESGKHVAGALEVAGRMIRPGVTTGNIDDEIESYILGHGATAEFKGYQGFPSASCISVNEEVVHGIPGPRRLREGDIVGIDVGVRKDGYVADGATTFAVGEISGDALRLLDSTRASLEAGLAMVRAGAHLSDVSHAIQSHVEAAGYSVVRELAGHGVGRDLHEAPEVPNFGPPGYGPILKAGMVLAIEPMVNAGGPEVVTLEDGWTVVTADGQLSAHFEHSVVVTADGIEILTAL